MTTNIAGNSARTPTEQVVAYIRKTIVFGDNGVAKVIGVIPAGSVIIKPMSGVSVNVAFNAGTTNVLDIGRSAATGGVSADDDFYATDLAMGTIAFVPLDEAVTMAVAADTTITATLALSGTAATAGSAEVFIAYMARP